MTLRTLFATPLFALALTACAGEVTDAPDGTDEMTGDGDAASAVDSPSTNEGDATEEAQDDPAVDPAEDPSEESVLVARTAVALEDVEQACAASPLRALPAETDDHMTHYLIGDWIACDSHATDDAVEGVAGVRFGEDGTLSHLLIDAEGTLSLGLGIDHTVPWEVRATSDDPGASNVDLFLVDTGWQYRPQFTAEPAQMRLESFFWFGSERYVYVGHLEELDR